MNQINNKTVAIIGGGPGGLVLAKLLQQKGVSVKVYERDLNETVRVQGATLDLHDESGLRAIREAGLMAAFEASYRPGADKLRIMDKSGNILLDEHTGSKTDHGRPEIDRGPLRAILLGSLAPGTVIWNHRFMSMSRATSGWRLQFENAPEAMAGIVVGADGASSKIRSYITPVKPFFAGLTAVEGAVPEAAVNAPKICELVKGGKIFAMGDERSLIVSSKGDGSLPFYAGIKTKEGWAKESGIDFNDRSQILDWFKKDFSAWDESWLELFENTTLPLRPRPQYCMPLDQDWESLADLTMLGDAAHLMPPYAGEGVNMAMLDAVELSAALTGPAFPDVISAISHYEKQMRRRASATAADTLASTAGLHGPDGTGFLLKMLQG